LPGNRVRDRNLIHLHEFSGSQIKLDLHFSPLGQKAMAKSLTPTIERMIQVRQQGD